jgi:hypothetical protein
MTRGKSLLPAFVFLAIVCAPGSAFAQTSVSGDWELTINSPQGSRTAPMSLTQDGEKITGMFKSQAGELPVEGTLTGNELKLAFSINVQGQALPITMTGTVDGAAIAGKANFGGFAEGDFSAKRAGATTASATAAPPAETPRPSNDVATGTGGVSGTWDVTIKTPGGEIPVTATLSDDAGKISGTMSTHLGELAVEGTLVGNALKLSMIARMPQGEIPVSLTGDVEGDAIMNGKADLGGMGQHEWTAKRRP